VSIQIVLGFLLESGEKEFYEPQECLDQKLWAGYAGHTSYFLKFQNAFNLRLGVLM